jgi:hypothetical protein
MATVRHAAPGATRVCPHCRQLILESADVCPVCRHHLRAGATESGLPPVPSFSPLRVQGTMRNDDDGDSCEYSITVSILDDRGEEISRQVMGVGAILPAHERTFIMAVEVFGRTKERT